MGDLATHPADDRGLQIKGYCSAISACAGESVGFHVTVAGGEEYTVAVYRVGHYGGAGGRQVAVSPSLRGVEQPPPEVDPITGRVSCRWPADWKVDVTPEWLSGYYLAVFTTVKGWRSYAPFVVRDDQRRASFCVIIPVTTYQAYNLWPLDGVRGRSLYYGHDPQRVDDAGDHPLDAECRANQVSFDRPYDRDGMPKLADLDRSFVRWAERRSYDMVYATSTDLHAGRVEPSRYDGLVFCGHDEYWSREMREAVERAVAGGTALAFLSANSVYQHIRFAPGADGTPDRVVICYKDAPDPDGGPYGATGRWRDPAPCPADPEERLLGVMYNGIVATPAPLVVRNSRHWFWQGTDVREGQRIPKVVSGEADGTVLGHTHPRQRLLSASPFSLRTGEGRVQHTSLIDRSRTQAMIFVAGTLHWSRALSQQGPPASVIQTATSNILNRIIAYGSRRR